ncbi:MAG: HAD-IB family phosphatase [Thermoleophilia bacterium]
MVTTHNASRQLPDEGRVLAVLDFDGTITAAENLEIVLQRMVGDAWRPLEDEVRAGRLSHAECLRRQIGLVRASRTEFLDALLSVATQTPGFAGFLADLHQRGGRAIVVSAGFSEAIGAFWRRERLPAISIFASEIDECSSDGHRSLALAFHPAFGDCPRCGIQACKGAIVHAQRLPGDIVVAFGDGASDLCLARAADLTFARGHLSELCRAEALPWLPLTDFTRAQHDLDQWLTAPPSRRPQEAP